MSTETSKHESELRDFIQKHFASLCAIAFKIIGDKDTAQDIAQEVIIKFWESQKTGYESPESLKDYLFIMAKNKSLNYLRSQVRERKRQEKAFLENEHEESAWDKIIEQETNQLLLDAIAILPPQSKRIVELSYEGKSLKEIAELLEISINTVKVLKSRALQKLRDFFARPDL